MTDSFLVRVGDAWITKGKKRPRDRRTLQRPPRYLLHTESREQAFRFTKEDAENIALHLRNRQEMSARFNGEQAKPVAIHPSND